MSAQNPVLGPSAVYAGAELLVAGVKIIDLRRAQLECAVCSCRWSRPAGPDGRRPRGYWKCPNGCNFKSALDRATHPAG